MQQYICKHFGLYELVSQELFEQYRDTQWRLWNIFDDRLLRGFDLLREDYGSITINDWYWGGEFNESGLRIPGMETYSWTSLHAWAKAFDGKPQDTPVEKIRTDILSNKKDYHKWFTGVETNISWLHLDTRNVLNRLTFDPNG